MRAVDANVLVRLTTRDDARQVAAAERFIAGGAWVPQLVLAESLWVLETVYELDRAALAKAVEMLLHHRDLTVQDADVVAAALVHFRQSRGVGFSDCLALAITRRNGHGPLGTFDRALGRLEGVERL